MNPHVMSFIHKNNDYESPLRWKEIISLRIKNWRDLLNFKPYRLGVCLKGMEGKQCGIHLPKYSNVILAYLSFQKQETVLLMSTPKPSKFTHLLK